MAGDVGMWLKCLPNMAEDLDLIHSATVAPYTCHPSTWKVKEEIKAPGHPRYTESVQPTTWDSVPVMEGKLRMTDPTL